ncbi:hypothetical protein I4U23_027065 [Adineta vaga]|nr:hypothetical protein I4U23_027065 [Adineta vaga]
MFSRCLFHHCKRYMSILRAENLPTKQTALQWIRINDKDPFQWTTSAPIIQPNDQQVLIENHAVSLNPIDHKMATTNFSNTKLPSVTGYDVSGRIVAIGKNVKDLQVNDEVFGMLNLNSSDGGGAFQQYSIAETDTLVKKPTTINHIDASTLGVAFLSAIDGLRQVNIDSSKSVFIPGGSGGVGHFSVQIAQIRGAKQVITSASKDEGIRILKEEYHIKDVINHSTENIIDRIMELTNGEGVDIVYDSTYLPSSFDKTIQTIKQGGSWIVLRRFGQDTTKDSQRVAERKGKLYLADLGRYWLGNERIQLKSFAQNSLLQGAKWIEEGKLKPFINRIIQLEEVPDTLELIKQGKSGFGKIVVKLLFYIEEPSITDSIKKFFLNYASISPDDLRQHLLTIRERAWQKHPYPCLGTWSFLDFSIQKNPIYQEILEKCKTQDATIIDFGCCLGQDVRKLIYDGVSIDQIRGYDIDSFFLEQGYELFCDKEQMKEKKVFQIGDIFDDESFEKISPADYVHVGSFIHLFDAQTQRNVCQRLSRLSKCAIIGRQVGSLIPGEHSRIGVCNGTKMMRHSPESFQQMWNEVTNGIWQVEYANLETRPNTIDNIQRLIFVVRKKSN